jgi:hypothetical protein
MFDLIPKEPLPPELHNPILQMIDSIAAPQRNLHALPDVLYHYTDSAGLKGIIEGGFLRATHLAHLNDAKEYLHAVSLLLDAVRLRKKRFVNQLNSLVLDELEEAMAPTQPEHIPSIFVTCFTGEANSLNQWRAYGKGEGGYSIGFDAKQIRNLSHIGVLTPVIYDPDVQRQMVEDLLDRSLAAYHQLAHDQPIYVEDLKRKLWWSWFIILATQAAPMMKDPAFKAEAEWRFVMWCHSVTNMDFAPRQTGLAPFTKIEFGIARNNADGVRLPNLLPIRKLWSGPGRATGPALVAGRSLLEKYEYFGDHSVSLEASSIPYRVG